METVHWLLNLVHSRALGTALERFWEKRTGVNPVLEALEYEEWRGTTTNVVRLSVIGALISGVIVVGWIMQVRYKGSLLDGILPFFPSFLALAAEVISIGGLLVSLVVGCFYLFDKIPPTDEAEAFAADVNALVHWLIDAEGTRIWEDFHEKKEGAEERLLANAPMILLLTARKILLLQERGQLDQDFLKAKQRLLESLKTKYDTLARLGLADGGYEKYFAAAQEQLAAS